MKKFVDPKLEDYAIAHSSQVPDLMEDLRQYTLANTELPQMQVGPLEGMFLEVLVRATGAKNIVEVGTFTGYSALMMAAGLPEDGTLTTCEIDDGNADIAQSFFDRSPHGHKITIRRGPAGDTLKTLEGTVDMCFIDADKQGYINYFEILRPKMKKGGLMVIDNVLWSGRILEDREEMDESTCAIADFNRHIQELSDVRKIMVTVRDGMTLIVA